MRIHRIPSRSAWSFSLSGDVRRFGRTMLTRRAMLLSSVSAMALGPTISRPLESRMVVLDEETLAIARDLVAKGYHRTVQEAASAAIEAMMVRDGWCRSG
jgi:hypothetical protein